MTRFFSLSARAEIQSGLKLSSCYHKHLFRDIYFGSQAEISAQLTMHLTGKQVIGLTLVGSSDCPVKQLRKELSEPVHKQE